MRRAVVIACVLLVAGACRAPSPGRDGSRGGGDPERGRELVRAYGCGSCHTVPGVAGAHAVVGPPLWGMAGRGYIGGVLPNTEAALIRWIQDPQGVTTRTAMPNLGVTESDARDMAAYLYTLRVEGPLTHLLRGAAERLRGRQVPDPTPRVPGGIG